MSHQDVKSHISQPEVAVLMATYNGEAFLQEQLDSLLQQEGVSVTIYARDDGSTDKTISILQTFRQQTGKLVLLDNTCTQLKAAKNFLSVVRDIDLSLVDYIAYCDQDDRWLPRKLQAAINAIHTEQVSCYASNLIMGDAAGRPVPKKSLLSRLAAYLFSFKANAQKTYDHYFEAASAGCTLVLTKEAAVCLQQVITETFDRIPTTASHDWSTYAITRLHGFTWYIDPAAYIIYRQHGANAYGANRGWKGIHKLLALFSSGWYRQHILLIDELFNPTAVHPPFIPLLKTFQPDSLTSRFRLAQKVYPCRRKRVHRWLLFLLIITGYFK